MTPKDCIPNEPRHTVLVAEDYGPLLDMTAEALRTAGFEVLATNSFEEALRIARSRSESLDLLITDIELPGGNGIQLREQVLAFVPSLLTLYVSGNAESSLKIQASPDPTVDFLPKPYAVSDLLRRIGDMLVGK